MTAYSREQVEEALDLARPELKKHGGDVKLLGVNAEGVVLVTLMGACQGCKHASATLHNIIEKELKAKLPDIKRVEAML